MRSTETFSYGSFRFTMTGGYGNSYHVFGLNSQTNPTTSVSGDAIYLRDDTGSVIYLDGVSQGIPEPAFAPSSLPTTYTFIWLPTEVSIYRDATLLFSTTNPGQIPNDPMHFEMAAFGTGNPAPSQFSFDDVAYQAVPEPSSLAIAAVGFAGLIAWGWRRKPR